MEKAIDEISYVVHTMYLRLDYREIKEIMRTGIPYLVVIIAVN